MSIPLKIVPPAAEALRIALLGDYPINPFRDLLETALRQGGFAPEFFCGEYDNYGAEILNPPPALIAFKPQVMFIMPSDSRCRYHGKLDDPIEKPRAQALEVVRDLLALADTAHARYGADIFLANFAPPARFDPGAFRTRTLASDWSFRRLVNLELGLRAPAHVYICDVDFLATRRGALSVGSPDFLADVAHEIAIGARLLRRSHKKVLVLDLDNTLWGGILAEEGLEEINLGPEFKAFQRYCLKLKERGILLAVCSKNDYSVATQPFLNHPQMILRMEHFVAFKANWRPKGENLIEIARELGLSTDSIVFADDNPAEIANVRQLAPAVTTIHLAPTPQDYVRLLEDSRLFEPRSLTAEDAKRTEGYFQEAKRKEAMSSSRSFLEFLQSLKMQGEFAPFAPADFPRISQLINKTNQFNVTTRRRSEGEVSEVAASRAHFGLTLRLVDCFGDYGLIAAVVGTVTGDTCEIETWVMSCRVLQRGVEEETLNEIVRLARERGCRRLVGRYLPTEKNGLVKDLYDRLGFARGDCGQFTLDLEKYAGRASQITIRRRMLPAVEMG